MLAPTPVSGGMLVGSPCEPAALVQGRHRWESRLRKGIAIEREKDLSYAALFEAAMGEGQTPYPYQRALASEAWPDLVHVPTGLGKTAAVTLAWAWRRGLRADGQRGEAEAGTPRRLVWCLPMRVLVEQTEANVRAWLSDLGVLGEAGEAGTVAVHTLMGGDPDLAQASWTAHPEQEAVLIGTQDMLLSRALMRGYGMSRYQWPVHYALLHNDALWVFDEVQLMGPALPTTTQLEAFRRNLGASLPARSIWVSATLQEAWLDTVDFCPHRSQGLRRLALGDADEAEPAVARRVHAPKRLLRAGTCCSDATAAGHKSYIKALAQEIAAAHVLGEQTLVIVNRVERAQALHDALADTDAERLLLHARYRPRDRAAKAEQLQAPPPAAGRIVIATQAVEAGVDLDSRVLFTELAPWASLVQRFGRCNRAGRFDQAEVYWIDLAEAEKGLALPYTAESLTAARECLEATESATPADLPPVTEAPPAAQVLRRRDLLELFNTDPDLSGFDVDVSPYIRDTGTPQVQVFWRTVDRETAPAQPAPARAELCPASISQVKAHLQAKLANKVRKATGREYPDAWRFDTLGGEHREGQWVPVSAGDIRPGQSVMLAAGQGGYDPSNGFRADLREPVEPVEIVEDAPSGEGYGGDPASRIGRAVGLAEHLDDVVAAMAELSDALALPAQEAAELEAAARWHDIGKAHEAFQRGIGVVPDDPDGPWAKSAQGGRPDYHVERDDGSTQQRPGFRHELVSLLAWLAHGEGGEAQLDSDLVAYVIAAHHGRVRMGLRALPNEEEPPEPGRLYARGVWDGDRLPAMRLDGLELPETELRLDIMRLGRGPTGPSWSERTHRLLEGHGPFRLAWLEALLRVADWRASAREARS